MQVTQFLPQRPPMLLIDKIIEVEKEHFIRTEYFFNGNEFFFQGHFPNNPICPGVITLEALGQTAIILSTYSTNPHKNWEDLEVYIASADNIKMKKIIRPQQTVTFEASLLRKKEKIWKFACKALHDKEIACSAELTLYINLH